MIELCPWSQYFSLRENKVFGMFWSCTPPKNVRWTLLLCMRRTNDHLCKRSYLGTSSKYVALCLIFEIILFSQKGSSNDGNRRAVAVIVTLSLQILLDICTLYTLSRGCSTCSASFSFCLPMNTIQLTCSLLFTFHLGSSCTTTPWLTTRLSCSETPIEHGFGSPCSASSNRR